MRKLLIFFVLILLCIQCKKEQLCFVPNLMFPLDGASLDNGCNNFTDPAKWRFDWDDCPDAAKYNILIKHTGSPSFEINAEVRISEFDNIIPHELGFGFVDDPDVRNWSWRVRSFVNDGWTEWSEERNFSIEDLNSDC